MISTTDSACAYEQFEELLIDLDEQDVRVSVIVHEQDAIDRSSHAVLVVLLLLSLHLRLRVPVLVVLCLLRAERVVVEVIERHDHLAATAELHQTRASERA